MNRRVAPGYYYTKTGPYEWLVSGRRHHLIVERTEGPTGRLDRHDEDVLQTIYVVDDRHRPEIIDLSNQMEASLKGHGFTTLREAVAYAVKKLMVYDDQVDPPTRRNPMKGYVHLQGLGDYPGTPIGALSQGDVVVFNYGVKMRVSGLPMPVGRASRQILWEAEDGKIYPAIQRKSTLVVRAGSRPAV